MVQINSCTIYGVGRKVITPPTPNVKPIQETLGEYNGKFMCNQFVLRGGSLATLQTILELPIEILSEPHQSWMFSGIRLAKDL